MHAETDTLFLSGGLKPRSMTAMSTATTVFETPADPTMREVFASVQLPKVDYRRRKGGAGGVGNGVSVDSRDDFHNVFDDMDNELAIEDSTSYRSSTSSLHSPKKHHHESSDNENHHHHHHESEEPAHIVAGHVTDSIFNEHELAHLIHHHDDAHSVKSERTLKSEKTVKSRHSTIGGGVSVHNEAPLFKQSEHEIEEQLLRERAAAAEIMREMEDKFDEESRISFAASRRSNRSVGGRLTANHRSMTVDSLASAAESRFGGFDVHDFDGLETSDEIDLEHNEVAYIRPRKTKTHPVAAPHFQVRPSAKELAELEEMHRKLALAHQQIYYLETKLAIAKEEEARLSRHSHHLSHIESPASVNNHHRSHSYAGHENHNHHHDAGFIYEEHVGISQVTANILAHGTEISHEGKKALIVPEMVEVGHFEKLGDIRKIVIGGQQKTTPEDKTVLLFGPVGSGKTSLINSMLNYLYDVKRENPFRLVVNDKVAHSRGLRAYTFNNSILPFSITVVDTPGVPDKKGDASVSTLVKNWFTQELHSAGSFKLDAISIVLRHDERRLEWPFIFELAAVKKMFGDDLKTNVLPFITHTEVLPVPVAVRALALANISFLQYYKVNNCGFFLDAPDHVTPLKHNLFFKHGVASLEKYFKDLQELIHPLLAVLRSHDAHHLQH